MLELPEITPREYEEKFAEYEQRFHALAGSSFSENSVGIVLLELLTYIQQLQQKNMNIISSEALVNLGRLYGGEPKRLSPARCFAAFDGEGVVQRGTKLLCENTVFETQDNVKLSAVKPLFFGRPVEGRVERYRFSDSAPRIELFDGCDSFLIGFDKAFEAKEEISLFLTFDACERRLPDDMSAFDVGSKIEWQYYGNEGGAVGWHPVNMLSDGTYNCFCSGALRFSIKGQQEKSGSFYPLRAVVKKRAFDLLPTFTGMYSDFCSAAQLDTKCSAVGFGREEFEKNAMYFSNALAAGRNAALFVAAPEGYVEASQLDVAFEIDDAEGGFRLVTSSRSKLRELFAEKACEQPLLLVLYEQPYVRDFSVLRSDGSANQHLKVNFSGVYPDTTEILVSETTGGKTGLFRWKRTTALKSCSPNERVFEINADGEVVFGDNVHGMIPPAGNVYLISLALTEGAAGNMPAGSLSAEDIKACRITPAEGGTSWERPDEFFGRILSEPKEHTLLSEEDYVSCALGCRGILLKRAEVYATTDEFGRVRQNSVTVSVQPALPEAEKLVGDLSWYLSNLHSYMSRLCPITTELIVRFPLYIPINVRVRAKSREYFRTAESEIRQCVERLFEDNTTCAADYSSIMRALNSLGCVSEVAELTLACSDANSSLRSDGSITAPPHSRVYLKKLDVRCDN